MSNPRFSTSGAGCGKSATSGSMRGKLSDGHWLCLSIRRQFPYSTRLDAHGMPIRVLITSGIKADGQQAQELIENIDAHHLIADRGYDSDSVIASAHKMGM